ncbi:MAG TPA: hypothetical protein VGV38_19555 [Pyrinomonadaceae bacterium]|nr:hypothetical protein [Pyrinomonadaceae bacterium]
MNFLSKHLPFETLADVAEGRAPAALPPDAQAHLTSCESCSGQLARLAQTVQLMRSDDSEAAPRGAVAYALGLFRQRVAATAEPSRLRRVLAALSFDSAGLTPAFGVRAGQPAAARQLLYSAGESDLDLRVAPAGEGTWNVSGQLLGACSAGRVELEGASGRVEAALNEQCEFTLPPVAEGTYTLRLRIEDAEVEVPELELRA